MKTFNTATLNQHAQMILDAINDDRITDEMIRYSEVHQEVFNTDYFIIGYHEASKWINENFGDAFTAVDIVKQYEMENFGEMYAEVNSEKIANMLSYICGEQVISELDQFDNLDELKEAIINYID